MNIRMKRGMALALTASLLLAGSAQALFGLGKSKPETVSPENGPTARDLEIRTYRGIPYLGQLEAADPDGGELTFAIVTPVSYTHLTLPFFSYGGSSVVTLFAAMGFVSGIKKRTVVRRRPGRPLGSNAVY